MDELETRLAEGIYAAVQESQHSSDRSEQAKQFRVGVSDLGFCSERLRRFLAREVPKETDMLKAFIGTWLGAGIEDSVMRHFPGAVVQSEVEITLRGDLGTYIIPGHPDIVLPDEDVLIDVKSSFGLDLPRRTGMEDQQKKFQRHLYASAMIDQGVLSPQCKVGNLWIDRSGGESEFHVALEDFDPMVIEDATQWLDEVVLAWQDENEARKEPPREMCAKACGFYQTCRMFDTDVEGLLTDPEVLTAVDMRLQATVLEREAKKLKAAASDTLKDVSGSTGTHLVRWTHINPTSVAYTRKAYDKLDITKIK